MALPLLVAWQRLQRVPGGARLFGLLLSRRVPYTGTIRPRFLEVRPGYVRAAMHDRRAVRNHLQSIHAVALVNLAEVVSGLAMMTGLPPTLRAIVIGLSINYTKKARGTLTAESIVELPEISAPTEVPLSAVIRDASGDVVATATVRWLVSPRPQADEGSRPTRRREHAPTRG